MGRRFSAARVASREIRGKIAECTIGIDDASGKIWQIDQWPLAIGN
jgi:hypothetical protein